MAMDFARMRENFLGMVDIYSPSGKEADVLAFVEEHVSHMGVPFLRQQVDDSRYNLIIGRPLPDAEALLVGHLDTVPAYDLERYEAVCQGDDIFGLGTADMKGGCAALLEAYGSYVRDHGTLPPASVCLLVGEEETGDGAKALVQAWPGGKVFVAEPTSLKAAPEHYGYAEFELVAVGERRHAAMANRERNAIYAMLKTLLAVSEYVEERFPSVVLNIRDVHSSEAGFAVADRCRAAIDLHIPPQAPFFAMVEEIGQRLRGCAGASDNLVVEATTSDPGWILPADAEIVRLAQAAFAATGRAWRPAPFQSHSDASVFARAGAAPLLFGPGQIAKAHTRNESISWSEIVDAATFYRALLEALPS